MWPFTDLSDPRFSLGGDYWTLRHDSDARGATKIGVNHSVGKAGYVNNGTLFVKNFAFDPSANYPDRGSCLELFANEEILEVETLGPLTKLKPGGVLEWVEEWELFGDVPSFQSDQSGGDCRGGRRLIYKIAHQPSVLYRFEARNRRREETISNLS